MTFHEHLLVASVLFDEFLALRSEEGGGENRILGSVLDVENRSFVAGRNLHCRVEFRRGGSADEERKSETCLVH